MHRALVARPPWRPRARLNLAPRLHAEETLSSWLERFADAYGMTLREFFLWLGYPDLSRDTFLRYDLDVSPPEDLARVLAPHAGIPARWIAAHRLKDRGALAPYRRGAFCPQCWAEEGPYRRREWARGWSLICRRHRRLLSERPPASSAHRLWYEESWSEFYRDRNAWRDLSPSWQSADWRRICASLGLEPQAEFLRLWPWLLELSGSAPGMARAPAKASHSASGVCERLNDLPDRPALPADELTVKEDLALYGMIRFCNFSLLQMLDATVSNSDLMLDSAGGDICDLRTPNAPLWTRLFAVAVARQLWLRMTRGQWRCSRHELLERMLAYPRRWSDEEWWLEQRLRTWPRELAALGRQLFHRSTPEVPRPPWERCRQCLSHAKGVVSIGCYIRLPESWRCSSRRPWVASEEVALFEWHHSSGSPRRSAAALDCTAPD